MLMSFKTSLVVADGLLCMALNGLTLFCVHRLYCHLMIQYIVETEIFFLSLVAAKHYNTVFCVLHVQYKLKSELIDFLFYHREIEGTVGQGDSQDLQAQLDLQELRYF